MDLRCDPPPPKVATGPFLRHFKGCSAILVWHCENIRRKVRHQCSATAVARHKWCSVWATKMEYWHGFSGERMEMAALMGRFQCLFLELLSINTRVKTYASARRTHGSKCTKMNLSKAFCASYGTPGNVSEPSFQHALVFLINATILWTKTCVHSNGVYLSLF